jgi:hypothetical protein
VSRGAPGGARLALHCGQGTINQSRTPIPPRAARGLPADAAVRWSTVSAAPQRPTADTARDGSYGRPSSWIRSARNHGFDQLKRTWAARRGGFEFRPDVAEPTQHPAAI